MSNYFFSIPFTGQTFPSPLVHAFIRLNSCKPFDNCVELGLTEAVKNPDSLEQMQIYMQRQLSALGAELKLYCAPCFDNQALGGRVVAKALAPHYISVEAEAARTVFDALFNNGEMSSVNRAEIEPSLRRLERLLKKIKPVKNDLFAAQKDIIQSCIQPYADDINEADQRCAQIVHWVHCAARGMKNYGLTSCREKIRDILWMFCKSGHDKSEGFYNSLCAVARVYAGLGNLEKDFEKRGVELPTKEVLQESVEELFDPAYVVRETQKKIIQAEVRPYVDVIKNAGLNHDQAKQWIKSLAAVVKILEPLLPSCQKECIRSHLKAVFNSGQDKGETFYEALYAIVRVYMGLGDLEKTFTQMGEKIPAKELVQKTIRDMFSGPQLTQIMEQKKLEDRKIQSSAWRRFESTCR